MPAPDLLLHSSVRRYSGEHQPHAHAHAQILYALRGRMELEVGGRSAFVDAVSGMVIPAGTTHAYFAGAQCEALVIDASPQCGLERLRRFVVPPSLRGAGQLLPAQQQMSAVLQAPLLQARRALDLGALQGRVAQGLHEDWPSARLAQYSHLSVQRFHARFVELCGCTPQAWVRGLRLDAAERWLIQGHTLDAAALRSGYASASALAYALRRERGLTAGQLRAGAQRGAAKSL